MKIACLPFALTLFLATHAAAVEHTRIGCFVHLSGQEIEQAKAAGFDFVELGLRDVVALPAKELDALMARRIPVEAVINFLPAELKVVGPQVDVAAQGAYLARAFGVAQRLGVRTVVFGSGKARSFPAGFERKEALRQLVEFGRRAAAEAKKHGLVIALEPLGTDETNTVNTVAEAVEVATAVGHPSFRIAIDYYHLTLSHEAPAAVLAARDRLQHVRIANPAGRAFPLAANEADYGGFFTALGKIGYRGAIGIETRTGSLVADGPRSVVFLRKAAGKLVPNAERP
jgi:sugar phosphate isomerase/epimerase